MAMPYLMGGPTSQFMIRSSSMPHELCRPSPACGADGKAVWTNEKLPLAPGFPANPALVYPGSRSPAEATTVRTMPSHLHGRRP